MSRSQWYLVFGHFGWVSFFNRLLVSLLLNCMSSVENWNYPLSSGQHIIATWGFVSESGFNQMILDPLCKLIQSFSSNFFVNIVGGVIILYIYIDGLVQDCSNSTANALELLQSCTKLSIWLLCVENYVKPNQSINQSINWSINQSINSIVNQLTAVSSTIMAFIFSSFFIATASACLLWAASLALCWKASCTWKI